MTNDRTPASTPSVAEIGGSIRQTLNDLAELTADPGTPWEPAGPLDIAGVDRAARILDRLARELAEAAGMARELTGHPREVPAVPFIGRSALTGLLTALSRALDIPPPAAAEDELTYLRLKSERAAEANRALLRVLGDKTATDLDLAWTGAWLDDAMRQFPTDAYAHSAMVM